MTQLTPEEAKKAAKEAIKEWMDEQAAKIGWSLLKWVATAIVAMVALWAVSHGKIP